MLKIATSDKRKTSQIFKGGGSANKQEHPCTQTRQRALSLKKDEKVRCVDCNDQIRPRTRSMPAKSTVIRPCTCHSSPHHCTGQLLTANVHDIGTYIVRQFEVNSKGVIKSRSDSLRSRSTSTSSDGDPCNFGQGLRLSKEYVQQEIVHAPYILVCGVAGVGKTALTQQFMTSEYLGGFNTSVGKLVSYVYILRGNVNLLRMVYTKPG